MQRDWQNKMWSPSASSFFAQFVMHTVTQYNTNTHIHNLLVAAKMKSFNVAPQATMEQQKHLDVWERSVSDQLDKAKAEHIRLSIESPANVQCARLNYHIQRLYQDLHDIQLSRQVDATYEHIDSVHDVPLPEPYYEELDTKAAYEFWNHRLDLKTATNIWNWARKSVPIEANLQAPNIGTVMSQTFSLMAHQTWTHVLRPRYENQMIRRALSQAGQDALADLILVTSVGAPELQKEDSRLVYRMLRETNQRCLESMPGIECVMVPSSGLNRQREGKHPKRDLEDDDIQFITPIAKRQNVRFI
ncbi:MAG: hypothetical protein LQ349_004413 [Xanthoria aureola]|nr:MAG: hypothetical protein LQ349_004413 [Xanthoria aureola]